MKKILLACVLLLSSCTVRQQTLEYRSNYLEKYEEEITPQIVSAINRDKVIVGMTKAQVIAAWGYPVDTNVTHYKGYTREQWVYGRGTNVKQFIYFELGEHQTRDGNKVDKFVVIAWN